MRAEPGTDELHLTNEFFAPIFRNRNFRTWALNWNTLYGIAYVGAGNAGFEFRDMIRTRDFAVDAGLGTETSIAVRDPNRAIAHPPRMALGTPPRLNTVRLALAAA